MNADTLAKPTPQQHKWADMEIGMFIHFAPNTWQDKEGDDLSTPLSQINPAKLDTDQWAQAAKKMGAKYIVFVAKHVGGFCMWPTSTTDYSIKNTPWKSGKGDVVADLAKSCKKFGLALGFYISPRSDHDGAGLGGYIEDPAKQKAYTDKYRKQIEELLTGYGPVFEVWFDGNTRLPVEDLIDKYAKKSICFQGPRASIRWVGNEDGVAPYPTWNTVHRAKGSSGESVGADGDPAGDQWMPAEVDVSIRRPYWFWSTTNHTNLLTKDQLLSIYYRSVGRSANLLLNVTPNKDGQVPTEDFERIKSFGDEIRRRFGKPVAKTSGEGPMLELDLNGKQIDHIVIMEDIKQGERVLEFVVEGKVDNRWRTVGEGTAIGHKRILAVEPKLYQALRFKATKAQGEPRIRQLAAFQTNSEPPKDWNK